jgi:hypothetical protein
MRYAIVIEKANGNYSAYVPDLPGCIAMARLNIALDCIAGCVSRGASDVLRYRSFTVGLSGGTWLMGRASS